MQETPLTPWHIRHGAKMAEFGGFNMPIEYTRILEEHQAVRTNVGMFDVSHMTEFRVEGPEASAFVDRLVTNWPSRLAVKQALYTPMCYPDGGTVDDLLVYRLDRDAYWLVANAANHDQDWRWINSVFGDPRQTVLKDESIQTALIALQGPKAGEILAGVATLDVTEIQPFHFQDGVNVAGCRALVSRTGYTGEDGFEIYLSASSAPAVWERLFEAGVKPIGLGARDTLRLEARLPLYGHELSPTITPLEAGLGGFVKWDKPGGFIGRDALWAMKEQGIARRLIGLVTEGGIARAGYPVGCEETTGGVVTSGTQSPTLGHPIALALVPQSWAVVGRRLWVEIRRRRVAATVVPLPFYRREA